MGRQLFLHHYLPAHLASALVAGALLEFVFDIEPLDSRDSFSDAFTKSDSVLTTDGSAKSAAGKAAKKSLTNGPARTPVRQRLGQQSLWAMWAAAVVVLAAVGWSFVYFAPLTYGTPGLTVEEVVKRKWLNYDLHFAK